MNEKIKLNNWLDGYIDFSELEFKGYKYRKSTYNKNPLASAFISEKDKELIKRLIPIYEEKEGKVYRAMRIYIAGGNSCTKFNASFLYSIYCNGFTKGFKEIKEGKVQEKNIEKSIKAFLKKLPDFDSENITREQIVGRIKLIGRLKGMELASHDFNQKKRGRPEQSEALSSLLTNIIINKKDILNFIRNFIIHVQTGTKLAYLRIALEELEFVSKLGHEGYHRALNIEFPELLYVGSDTIRNSYNMLNRKDEEDICVAKNKNPYRKEINNIKADLVKINSENSNKFEL